MIIKLKIPKIVDIKLSIINPNTIIGAEEVMFNIEERFTSIKCISDTARVLTISSEGIIMLNPCLDLFVSINNPTILEFLNTSAEEIWVKYNRKLK